MSIEGRVSTLETKVDELPDRVFESLADYVRGTPGRRGDEDHERAHLLLGILAAPFRRS
jgi:hypothetical protein